MAIPGTLPWIKKWYTDYAFGICKRIATGPAGEDIEEFRDEMATCVAWFYEGADVFLGKYDLSPEHIREVKEYLNEEARDVFGEERWETAKYIARHFKEIFEKAKRGEI